MIIYFFFYMRDFSKSINIFFFSFFFGLYFSRIKITLFLSAVNTLFPFDSIYLILLMKILIKNIIDSIILNSVLVEVPNNSLQSPNFCREESLSFGLCKRSTFFSAKRQSNFPPSKHDITSSIDVFHYKILYYIINIK